MSIKYNNRIILIFIILDILHQFCFTKITISPSYVEIHTMKTLFANTISNKSINILKIKNKRI